MKNYSKGGLIMTQLNKKEFNCGLHRFILGLNIDFQGYVMDVDRLL